MYQERFDGAKRDLESLLISYSVSPTVATGYADKFSHGFVESGYWTKGALDELKEIVKTEDWDSKIYTDICDVVKKYQLTFAERARLELERDKSDLTPEEMELRKADLLALEEMEGLCSGKSECKVTKEHYELFNVLTEGLDPANFKDFGKPKVTKEEVAQFRELGKKFGLNEDTISKHIEFTLRGTPSALAQRLVSHQTVIDDKRKRDHLILTSGAGAFRK